MVVPTRGTKKGESIGVVISHFYSTEKEWNGIILVRFQESKSKTRRKPFPIPKIQDMLLNLEGFTYASYLDLNMGYYDIELSPGSKQICSIVLLWGKYKYQKLPMGVCNSTNILQEKISEQFERFDIVCELFQTQMGQFIQWTSTVPVIGDQFRVHVLGSKTLF